MNKDDLAKKTVDELVDIILAMDAKQKSTSDSVGGSGDRERVQRPKPEPDHKGYRARVTGGLGRGGRPPRALTPEEEKARSERISKGAL